MGMGWTQDRGTCLLNKFPESSQYGKKEKEPTIVPRLFLFSNLVHTARPQQVRLEQKLPGCKWGLSRMVRGLAPALVAGLLGLEDLRSTN